MGVDPATDDLMARKPRHLNDRLIDARMWSSVIQTGLVIALVSLLTMDQWLRCALMASSVLIYSELRKLVNRVRTR